MATHMVTQAQNLKDRTAMFKALAQEFKLGGGRGVGLETELERARADLDRYFTHPKMLEMALSSGALTFEHSFIRSMDSVAWFQPSLTMIIEEFREAFCNHPDEFRLIWSKEWNTFHEAIDNFASVAELQKELDTLDFPLACKSCLRDIGDLLEGTLQRQVKIRLKVWSLLNRSKRTVDEIDSLSFGNIISELLGDKNSGKIYKTPLTETSVSQWRNIANHNSYQAVGEKVLCTYGRTDSLKTFELSFEELFFEAIYINRLCYLHKVAGELFNIDNLLSLMPSIQSGRSVNSYTLECNFAYALLASGFEILHAACGPYEWRFLLIDKLGREPEKFDEAFKNACFVYLKLAEPKHFAALVRSNHKTFSISFSAGISDTWDGKLPGFRTDLKKIRNYLRKKLSDLEETDSEA